MNKLTPEYYGDRIEVIKENKKRAIEFANFDERIFKEIMKHDRTNDNDPK